jgi:hypothetical protein
MKGVRTGFRAAFSAAMPLIRTALRRTLIPVSCGPHFLFHRDRGTLAHAPDLVETSWTAEEMQTPTCACSEALIRL